MTAKTSQRVIFYSLPTAGPGASLEGRCLVVPDGEGSSPASGGGQLVLRRSELAALFRAWRRSDPRAKRTPRQECFNASLLFSIRGLLGVSVRDSPSVSGEGHRPPSQGWIQGAR